MGCDGHRALLRRPPLAYVEPPAGSPAAIFEIMELTDATSGMGAFIRDAAKDWDGSDPVRTIGG
jgi:hypothetical protein